MCVEQIYALIINIQKKALTFFNHFNSSSLDSIQSKAVQTQEQSIGKSLLYQLVLRLTTVTSVTTTLLYKHQSECTKLLQPIQNIGGKKETKILQRNCELAQYLSTVRDRMQRWIQTKYRLSDDKIDKGRHKNMATKRKRNMCSLFHR